MVVELFTNNGLTTVSAGGTTAPSGGTVETWTVASSTSFPAAATGVSEFTVADPAAPTEKVKVTNVSGSSWTVERGAEGTTPVAHTAGFTVRQVVSANGYQRFIQNPMTTLGDLIVENATPAPVRLAGNTAAMRKFLRQIGTGSASALPAWDTLTAADMAAPFPWRFYVDDPAYGAVGDGKVVGDVSTTSGSGVITSATAGFTAGDIGKTVMVNGGNGSAAAPLITTIASFQSSTQVTLAATAGATASNCQMVWGTDDQAAIQAAIDAAGVYALANNYLAEVIFGAKIYMLTGAPGQSGNGSSTPTFNTQLKLPTPVGSGASRKLVIALRGAGEDGHVQYWESFVPNLSGTVLVSTRTAPSSPDATFGVQSVIGGPTGGAGFTGGFANAKAVIKNLQVYTPVFTNMIGIQLGWMAAARVEHVGVMSFAVAGVDAAITAAQPHHNDLPASGTFQANIGEGIRFPVGGNNADTTADNVTVAGISRGLAVYDHFTAGRLFVFYSDVALRSDTAFGGTGSSHGIFIQNLSAEAYNGGIKLVGGPKYLYIVLDAEAGSPAYDLSGSSNVFGELHFMASADTRTFILDGANPCPNLKIVDDNLLVRGFWSGAPAIPATGVASTPIFRDMMLQVTGGTVTGIAIDGQTTGLTSGVFFVPSGKAFTLTYSVAPTVRRWLT